LIAERLSVGYVWSLVLFAGAIALVTALHYWLNLNAVLAFWIAYILTRPLGASTGDLLSQARHDGGLGLGTTVTSFAFLAAILVLVTYLSLTRRDVTESTVARQADLSAEVLVVAHRMTAATPALLEAIRARVALGPVSFHLLVPNPAEHAEITDSERERMHLEGEHALALALPIVDQAAGQTVIGSVSPRHDPMDAIEEMLRVGGFHEIILSTPPHHISSLLHADLAHRVGHLGIPLTTVTANARPAVARRRQALFSET
jgi:hypothetical protein